MQNSKYRYSVGGLTFALDIPEFTEGESLSIFRTGRADGDVTYRVTVTDGTVSPANGELLFEENWIRYVKTGNCLVCERYDERDGSLYMTDTVNGDAHEILFNASFADYIRTDLVTKMLNIPRAVIPHGGVFLHSSFIDAGGEAILFTGPKQMGKSTQAALWEKYRGSETVNGDRALLRKKDGRWYAWGSPYSGTSGICKNRSLPVKAIVVLSQAEESTACRTAKRRALGALLDGCSFDTWDKEAVSLVLDTAGEIIKDVPVVSLACRPDESAICALEKVL